MCKRTKEQIAFDRAFCADLFLRGYPYREIAKRLNDDLAKRKMEYRLTESMVYYDIQQLLIAWKRDQLESIDQYVTAELQKLDKMEVEAWNAWELSKQTKTKNKTKKAAPADRASGGAAFFYEDLRTNHKPYVPVSGSLKIPSSGVLKVKMTKSKAIAQRRVREDLCDKQRLCFESKRYAS